MTDQPQTPDDELTYALIHGGGDVGWAWHLVEAELHARGRRTVAIDLPVGPDVDLSDQADAVVTAVGDAEQVAVVCHSFGGFVGPLVAERLPGAILLVFAAGMVPRPGESPDDWWEASGFTAWPEAGGGGDDLQTFYHDLEPALAAAALARGRSGELRGLDAPWPARALPAVTTRHVNFRQDRFFPPGFMREMVRERLGIEPDELDGGHCAMLSQPLEIARYLEQAVAQVRAGGTPLPV